MGFKEGGLGRGCIVLIRAQFRLFIKFNKGNLHCSPWEGKLLLEGPNTFQNNYQVPWAFPAIFAYLQ